MSTPPDPSVLATLAPAKGPASKVRLRFSKAGSLRWLSHHDLLRTFERMLRRANLPFRRTQGFNPHPRLIFALSLPLGVVGLAEVAELELDEPLSPGEVREQLQAQCPPGLDIIDAIAVPPRTTAQVRGLCYALPLPSERVEPTRQAITALLSAPDCWIERRRPSGGALARRMDLRPFLRDLRLTGDPVWLEMDLWLTPEGTARPEEVLALLELKDLLDAGCVLHRLRLELHDEPPREGQASAEGEAPREGEAPAEPETTEA